jgi:N-acyl homoserine lactone hydrolase
MADRPEVRTAPTLRSSAARWRAAIVAPALLALVAASVRPAPELRLYVFDCGTIEHLDPERFGLHPAEVHSNRGSVMCYLIVHPKGTLVWDTGAVPDSAWTPTDSEQPFHLTLPGGGARDLTLRRSLTRQLADAGCAPSRVTYLALSHDHYDHTANANLFAASTWLVRQNEHDAMFREPAPAFSNPATYGALRQAKTILITSDEYDVFGDGTVILKAAPGHTPGHQVLLVRLVHTGPVVIAGDLYHYPEQRALDRLPTFDDDSAQTRRSRVVIEAWVNTLGAQLWIQHDFVGNARLRTSPAFYE